MSLKSSIVTDAWSRIISSWIKLQFFYWLGLFGFLVSIVASTYLTNLTPSHQIIDYAQTNIQPKTPIFWVAVGITNPSGLLEVVPKDDMTIAYVVIGSIWFCFLCVIGWVWWCILLTQFYIKNYAKLIDMIHNLIQKQLESLGMKNEEAKKVTRKELMFHIWYKFIPLLLWFITPIVGIIETRLFKRARKEEIGNPNFTYKKIKVRGSGEAFADK